MNLENRSSDLSVFPRGAAKVYLAHDDKLWVTAPGLKFVHPRSARLNDFELLEVLVPISVGSPYDVLSLLVC